MATYQGEKYIRKQLESIFQQTITVDEIIIFDDNSTDNTLQIVKEFQTRNEIDIKLYTQPHQQGYILNFASALREATGDIIFLCDQDDIWENTKVESMLALFQKDKKIMCINTSFTYIDEHDQEITLNNHRNYNMCDNATNKEDIQYIKFEEITLHNISMGCTMAFRSIIKDEYLNKSNFTAAHDWELNFISVLHHGLVFYNSSLIKYRIHENNTTGNDKIAKENHVYATEREKNASALLQYANALKTYNDTLSDTQISWCKQLLDFHQNRYIMLHHKKPMLWFKLLKSRNIYKKIVTKKGRIVDLLYSIHK